MSKSYQGKRKPSSKSVVSPQTKKALLALGIALGVIGGGYWAYLTFTTLPPPDPGTSNSDQVVDYLGHRKGFARLSVNRRQAYLGRALERYGSGEPREQFYHSLRRMSSAQRRVFLDAFFEVTKEQFISEARKYNRLKPKERRQFVNDAIRGMESARGGLVGAGSSAGPDLAEVFQNDAPRGGDELTKRIWKLTNPREREEGRKFADDLSARYKELQNPKERQRFDAGR